MTVKATEDVAAGKKKLKQNEVKVEKRSCGGCLNKTNRNVWCESVLFPRKC